MSLNVSVLDDSGQNQEIYGYLSFSDVFAAGAPSGTLGSDGFKYPINHTQFADNLVWALNNMQVFSKADTLSLASYFIITRQGDHVIVTQNVLTRSASIVVNYESNAPVNMTVIIEPMGVAESFVQNPVLGVLINVDSNHMAMIDKREVIQVKLAADLRFHVNDPANDGFYGNIFYRLLKPVDNGQVAPIFPDTKIDNMVDELSILDITETSGYTAASGGSHSPTTMSDGLSAMASGQTIVDSFDLLRVNSTVYYEALQEGNAGDTIFVRRFSFLLPPGTAFPVKENYYGYNYGYGYYY